MGVDAGGENLSVYDLRSNFVDPEGDPLFFTLLIAVDPEAGLTIALNGSFIDLRSSNASWWGGAYFNVFASDTPADRGVESNQVRVLVAPSGVVERTWHFQDWSDSDYSGGRHEGCGTNNYFLITLPWDAHVTELSFRLGRTDLVDPTTVGSNESTDSGLSLPNADSVQAVVHFGDVEVLNTSVPTTIQLAYFNVDAVNAFLRSDTSWRIFDFYFGVEVCAWAHGMPAKTALRMYYATLDYVRLPRGDNGSDVDEAMANATLPSVTAITVGGGQVEVVTASLPTTFAVQTRAPLPSSARIGWYFDGRAVGGGTELADFVVPAGPHVFQVRVAAANVFRVFSLTINAVPAAPPPSGTPIDTASVFVILGLIGVGIALGGTQAGRYVVVGALVGLAAVRKKPSLLDHFVRGQIYQVIQENPGIHFAEIARLTRLGNGSVTHHLHVLEKGRLVRVIVDGSKIRIFLSEHPPDPEHYGLSPSDRKVLDAVFETPGAEQLALANRLGLSKSRVSRSVGRLVLLGYVLKTRHGRSTLVYPRSEEPPSATGAMFPVESPE